MMAPSHAFPTMGSTAIQLFLGHFPAREFPADTRGWRMAAVTHGGAKAASLRQASVRR